MQSISLMASHLIPLCCLSRAPRCRSFPAEASYGYCAAKDEPFYGFRRHLLISASGMSTGFTLTPANVDEPEAWDILAEIEGLLIGAQGYINQYLVQN